MTDPKQMLEQIIKGRKDVLARDAMPGRPAHYEGDKFILLTEMLKKAIEGLQIYSCPYCLDNLEQKTFRYPKCLEYKSCVVLDQLTSDIEKLAGK